MKKKNGKNQVASTTLMEDALIKEIQNDRRFKRRASDKAANPKKPKKPNKTKSNVSQKMSTSNLNNGNCKRQSSI